ncbi:putative quercetin 2,3-dioxygenase [Vibrio zhanjiangensis]|uniref:Quercetin 2,3-dioxygenase n=1 Tax=Vibrio zhanjiangensis TaxID=1046128 RepID=A0ABQ6EWD0_9VIBR|nr:pirin family protein [Vibrio zhanjiangensis]GLT17485.1 putative quercetin 2,3-dioxygenase [Vibrio zhanjiangensis]
MNYRREIVKTIRSRPTSDGDGVKISRVTGFDNPHFSPFLMLDELKTDNRSDYIGGFPPHPHRGIETLTYMLKGHFQHKDHMGNVGELRSGGAQWMASGKGVIHSEMPIMEDGDLHGFQIWINQPAANKVKPAQYRDFQSETITEYTSNDTGLVRVLAGDVFIDEHVVSGPLRDTGVPLSVTDWQSQPNQSLNMATRAALNVIVYVYKGQVNVADQSLDQGQLAVLSQGDCVQFTAQATSGVLVLQGEPIDEPVVHYGPFVMNSTQEIEQAISDYNSGEFETY